MAFIGMNIAMDIVSLPKLDQYWSTDPILSHPWFCTVMSCLVIGSEKFCVTSTLLTTHRAQAVVIQTTTNCGRSDPSLQPLRKIAGSCIHPISNYLLTRAWLEQNVVSPPIQYMPAKPVKWGVKVWVLCDSVNGYICTFDVYTGKDTSGATMHAHGLAYSIVMKLVQSYLKKGHIIYTDNFYSSPQLFEDLRNEGTYASGTVRNNRKHFPDFLKPQPGDRLDRGSHVCLLQEHHCCRVEWQEGCICHVNTSLRCYNSSQKTRW